MILELISQTRSCYLLSNNRRLARSTAKSFTRHLVWWMLFLVQYVQHPNQALKKVSDLIRDARQERR
jgi:hypothetical protein